VCVRVAPYFGAVCVNSYILRNSDNGESDRNKEVES